MTLAFARTQPLSSPSYDLLPHSFFTLPGGERLRYAQFAPSPLIKGTILIVPGGREFIEKKHAELCQPLLDMGYRLIVYEPRGQGLSTRDLKDEKRQRVHIDDFDTHIDDLRAFYAGVVLPGLVKPLIVHGHSLGAHVLLRWLAEDKPEVAGAFLTAPMTAFSGMAAQMMTYGLSWISTHLFDNGTNYAPMQHDFGGNDLVFENNPLTHDEARFRLMENYFAAHPELVTGGVTWGWMLAALKSMSKANTWPYLANIDIPVLCLTGDQDIVTPYTETMPFLNMIPHVRTRVITGARHDLLSETDDIRAAAWQQISDFLSSMTAEK